MSDPPMPDAPDEVDDRYRRASALDPSRPGEAVRRRVLEHATQVAAERASRPESVPQRGAHGWRTAAVFGTLAAAALAGLLIAPRFLMRPPREVPRPPPPIAAELAADSPAEAPARAQVPASPPVAKSMHSAADSRSPVPNASAAADTAVAGVAAQPVAAPAARRAALSPPAANVTEAGAALRQAAATGDLSTLDRLLAKPSDINARDAVGRTPLMLAVLHAQTDAVSALLAYGADPNAADTRGITPLQAARAAGRPAIIAALQRYGAR